MASVGVFVSIFTSRTCRSRPVFAFQPVPTLPAYVSWPRSYVPSSSEPTSAGALARSVNPQITNSCRRLTLSLSQLSLRSET